MKTQYYTAASLDGFITTPDHNLDWLLQFGFPEDGSYASFIGDVGAIVMGSSTYEWVLRNAVEVEKTIGSAWPYTQPTWVFTTRSLPAVPGADIRFVQGDVRPAYEEMTKAAAGKNIWIVGGGELAGQFYDAGLLDELIIQIAPVTLGKGIPVFPRGIVTPPMQLMSSKAFGSAFVEIRYAIPRR
jgi:dihydrofolate reductase